MIIIRFATLESKRRALGYLLGRFPFTSRATGQMLVPEGALASLAVEGIQFTVDGPATYEQLLPTFRDPTTPAVQ
jgi:hypothetical protein